MNLINYLHHRHTHELCCCSTADSLANSLFKGNIEWFFALVRHGKETLNTCTQCARSALHSHEWYMKLLKKKLDFIFNEIHFNELTIINRELNIYWKFSTFFLCILVKRLRRRCCWVSSETRWLKRAHEKKNFLLTFFRGQWILYGN